MTTENKFITSFTSTWHQIMPLADKYWRTENMLITKITDAIENKSPAKMRGFINELAFNGFCKAEISNKKINLVLTEEIDNTLNYINRIDSLKRIRKSEIDEICLNEAEALVKNLQVYFKGSKQIIFRPKFQGCGIVNDCEGDIIDGVTLYEIKAGDRNFRITDIRQLFLYSALAFSSKKLIFNNIGLFNPRTGKLWVRDINKIAQSISGSSGNDVLSNIVQALTPFESSR